MHAALVNQAKQGDREAFDALARLTGDRCIYGAETSAEHLAEQRAILESMTFGE